MNSPRRTHAFCGAWLGAVLFLSCSDGAERPASNATIDASTPPTAANWLEATQPSGGMGGEAAAQGPANSPLPCPDIDECATKHSPCDPVHGVCTNTMGGYACHCAEGSVGDGVFCKDEADCQADSCQHDGECLETRLHDGYRCVCPLGLTGPQCENANGCALDQILNAPESPLIQDANLEAALLSLLQKGPGELMSVGDLLGHYALILPPPATKAEAMTSLQGLECWTTLNELSAPGHGVQSLKPLRDLNFLLKLNLDCNPIASLSPLSDHVLLEELRLSTSMTCGQSWPAKDTEVLASLVGLRTLSVESARQLDPVFRESLRQLETEVTQNDAATSSCAPSTP